MKETIPTQPITHIKPESLQYLPSFVRPIELYSKKHQPELFTFARYKQKYHTKIIVHLLVTSIGINLLATNIAQADAKMGAWGKVIEWPHIAVSASNLPDGSVLTWAASERTEWSSYEEKTP